MFCDLVGSTALASRLDPEDLRDVIAAYRDCVAAIIRKFAGVISRYIGDGMLILFGHPSAHEDDAERAVRAALEIAATVRSPASRPDIALQVRVGIATGLVIVGDLIGVEAVEERAVVGETPNLADRLQTLAEPNSVVIAESTRLLLGALFDYEDLGAVEVKGFPEPVHAYQVIRESDVESRFEALHSSALTPLVGREEEMELLLRRWQQAKRGEGRVVLLAGEPGIGKSRLTATLQQHLVSEPCILLRRFCSPHHQDSALHPVIAQLERAAGIKRDDTPNAKLGKLEVLLAPASPPAEDVALLAELLSIPIAADRYPALNLTSQRKKEKTLEALLRQLAALARQRPVLMVYEDVHWIDPSSRELLDLMVDRIRRLPVLLLITFRPEFQSPWTGQAHVTMLALNRLDQRAAAALVERIVGHKRLPSELVDEIVGRTDGVPLFIEELTKAVLESGLLREEEDRFVLSGPPPPLAVPTSLHASLLARLDRLAPVKEVAQMGAAIGREFSYQLLSAVAHLPDQELQRALDQLVDAGLMFRRGTPPQATFLFKHALVQDAAYSTLLRDRRRDLHARIAKTLETEFADIVKTQPELLAHHCTQAGLLEKALDYWFKAGRLALTRSATTEAIAQLEKGLRQLDGLPDELERHRREIDLQIALGEAFMAARGLASPEMQSAYDRACELCRRTGETSRLMPALYGVWSVNLNRAKLTAALEAAQDLLHSTRDQGDVAAEWIAHRCIAASRLFRGEFVLARPHYEQSLALYERARQGSIDAREDDPNWNRLVHDAAAASRSMLAWTLLLQGYPDQALVQGQKAIAAAQQSNDPYTLATVLHRTCVLHQLRRDRQALIARSAELIALTAEQGYAHWLATGTIFRGWGMAVGGERELGMAEMLRGLAAKQATGAQLKVPYYLGLIAGLLSEADRAAEALPLLAEAFARVEGTGERWFEAEFYRLRGEALRRLRDRQPSDAEASFLQSREVARTQQTRLWELRACTSIAQLWRDQGRGSEAHDLLGPVYGCFTEGFDTPDLKEAKALLDALG
jgi:class 3 adenylate cyclase/predicted ATPase